MTAKEYLKDKVIFPNEKPVLLNSGELIDLMEGYAATKPYSPEVARRLLKIKDYLYGPSPETIEIIELLKDVVDASGNIKVGDSWWAELERIAKGE